MLTPKQIVIYISMKKKPKWPSIVYIFTKQKIIFRRKIVNISVQFRKMINHQGITNLL